MAASLLRVPAFVVLSGGPIGAASVRQLLRAIGAGRLAADRIVVVDRDPACEASRLEDPRIELAGTDWTEWLLTHLDRLDPASHLVPYHWAPHVLVDWLAREVEQARGTARRGGGVPEMRTPVDRATREGDRALSYATWICPPTCIEPRLCPHTRAPKDWSLAADLAGSRGGDGDDGAHSGLERIVFRCLHLVWGVGTVPVGEILSARDRILSGLGQGTRRYLVATSSHCHALATTLEVTMSTRPTSRRDFFRSGALAGALAVPGLSRLAEATESVAPSSRPSDLKITEIKCGYIRGGSRLFVKIHTNQDIWGCGEGVDATGGTYHLVKRFSRILAGKSPLDVHRLYEDLRRSGVFAGAQAGMYVAVLSAVEAALWDLTGKALGLPVYRLLGGKFRDRIRVYCDTALYQRQLPKPEDFAAAAREAVGMGFTACKFDLDQANDPKKFDAYNWTASPGEVQRMVDQITAAREAVGREFDICADMHGRYDTVTGMQVAKRLEPLNLMWLEEPIPAESVEAYRRIAESTSTPICAGENHYLASGFLPLLTAGAVDIVMPDLQKTGGLGEGQRIANLANLYYAPFAPHMVASYLGAMASAHVCASVPNFLILEWQIYFHKEPMYKEIVSFDGPMLDKGFLPLSDKPGIGVEINEDGMRKYAQEGVPFFE